MAIRPVLLGRNRDRRTAGLVALRPPHRQGRRPRVRPCRPPRSRPPGSTSCSRRPRRGRSPGGCRGGCADLRREGREDCARGHRRTALGGPASTGGWVKVRRSGRACRRVRRRWISSIVTTRRSSTALRTRPPVESRVTGFGERREAEAGQPRGCAVTCVEEGFESASQGVGLVAGVKGLSRPAHVAET